MKKKIFSNYIWNKLYEYKQIYLSVFRFNVKFTFSGFLCYIILLDFYVDMRITPAFPNEGNELLNICKNTNFLTTLCFHEQSAHY